MESLLLPPSFLWWSYVLPRSHKCHAGNRMQLIAIVETWSCWAKEAMKSSSQQSDNKEPIIKTFFGFVADGKAPIKRLKNLILSSAEGVSS